MEYEFEKLANFRDLGGMKAAEGKTVVSGRLLRSGELSKLTEEDIGILTEKYHLRNIVDLRTKNEKKSSPDVEIPRTNYIVLDFLREKKRDRRQAAQSS